MKCYELPYRGRASDFPTIDTKDHFVKNYELGLSTSWFSLRFQGLPA